MNKNDLAIEDHRQYLVVASMHVLDYYGFHWPPNQLRVLFEDHKGVYYITHWQMGGMIITVKRDDIRKRYIVRSFKHQYTQAKSISYVDNKLRKQEKGAVNGNA